MKNFALRWLQASMSTVALGPKSPLNFFKYEEPNGISTHSRNEPEIVQLIVDHPAFLNTFTATAGLNPYSAYRVGVPTSLIKGKGAGDFDLILFGPTYPYNITCCEFKVVKITAGEGMKDDRNKMEGIGELYKQVNDRIKIGFHRTVAVIILHGDLQLRKTPNIVVKDYSPETYDEIARYVHSRFSAPEGCGLVLTRFDQPSGNLDSINFAACLLNSATPMEQKPIVTDRFSDLRNSR